MSDYDWVIAWLTFTESMTDWHWFVDTSGCPKTLILEMLGNT